MNTTGKWLVRAGALLVIFGFVLPFMTVSCAAVPGYGQAFSLSTLAAAPLNQMILYLVPVGALVAIVLTLIPAQNRSQTVSFLWGQLGASVISALSIIGTMASLNSQVNTYGGFKFSPQIGLFALLAGYALIGYGLVRQWGEAGSAAVSKPFRQSPIGMSPPEPPPPIPKPTQSQPWLELVHGDLPYNIFPIQSTDFFIGRGSDNDLQIPDPKVSRKHARLRQAQGAWYIQDQESSAGTLVNGQPLSAARLNPGDRILMGETEFIFRM